MKRGIKLFLVIAFALHLCDGVSLRRQLQHIIDSRLQSLNHEFLPFRRFYKYDPREISSILGVPSRPSHLPEAEPILPGHTLLRPAIGMLKSSLKFPHKDLEDGSGVYGNIDNLGIRLCKKIVDINIANLQSHHEHEKFKSLDANKLTRRESDIITIEPIMSLPFCLLKGQIRQRTKPNPIVYDLNLSTEGGVPILMPKWRTVSSISSNLKHDARNERLLYSGFRRFPSDYIMVVPAKGTHYGRPRFKVVPAVLDMEQKEKTKYDLLKILKRLNILKGAKIFVANLGGNNFNMTAKKDLSNYLNLNEPNKAKLHSHVLRTSATAEEESVEKQKESISNEQPMNSESTGKMKLLLDSKDLYNNIKVHKNAPDLKEFMPKEYQEDNIRNWWYYNADDYTPFDD